MRAILADPVILKRIIEVINVQHDIELMKKWADRHHWPATLRWQMVGLHLMSDERFDKAADFIDAAIAADARAVEPELHED